MIPQWASSGPLLFVFLFIVVFFRAQATYWLARLTARGALAADGRSGFIGKIAAWFDGPVPRSGARLLEKWGLLIIPLCFLTVGIQTAVNAGAGIVRMKWQRYTLAMLPGCIAWAILYGMGLLAVWITVVTAIAGSPWAWAALSCVAVLIVGVVYVRHRKQRESAPEDTSA